MSDERELRAALEAAQGRLKLANATAAKAEALEKERDLERQRAVLAEQGRRELADAAAANSKALEDERDVERQRALLLEQELSAVRGRLELADAAAGRTPRSATARSPVFFGAAVIVLGLAGWASLVSGMSVLQVGLICTPLLVMALGKLWSRRRRGSGAGGGPS